MILIYRDLPLVHIDSELASSVHRCWGIWNLKRLDPN